jgi:repressor LexA
LRLVSEACIYNQYWFSIQVFVMSEMTKRQREILEWIQRVSEERGAPPTRVEIAQEFGFKSPNAAEEHLRALARKGMIELLPGAARGIRFTDPPKLPVVGRVAAGSPILAQQHIEAHFPVDPKTFRPPAHYLLRVHGMSMRDAGILDGDLVAVHRTPEVRNGQIIVARINHEEVTVKRYRQTGRDVWLMPENTDFHPIRIDLENEALVIEGVVVGVLRTDRLN